MLFGKYASRKSEAKYPQLWDDLRHVYCPAIQPPSGLMAYDFGGRNLHGTFTLRSANLAWARGSLGNAHVFAGSNVAEPTSTQGRIVLNRDLATDRIGISCWIRPSSLVFRGICTSGPDQANPRFGISVRTDGTLQSYRGGDSFSTLSVTLQQWNHIFVWSDGTNTSYWVNGRFSNTASQTISKGLQSQFFVGSNYWGAFDGQIAEFAVYDRLPSARSLRRLATAPGMMFATKRNVLGEYVFKPYFARRQNQIIGGGLQ